MKAKHTTGPWKVSRSQITYEWDVYSPTSTGRCTICNTQERTAIAHADARLIAAAPELLKELQKIVDTVNEHNVMEVDIGDAEDLIAKVKEKVRGDGAQGRHTHGRITGERNNHGLHPCNG